MVRLEAQLAEQNELEHVKTKRVWQEKLIPADFEGLRRRPTEREWDKSMNNWHKGIHYPYDVASFEARERVKTTAMKEATARQLLVCLLMERV
jgi:hypothetical protein